MTWSRCIGGLESVMGCEGVVVASELGPGGVEIHQPRPVLITPVEATTPAPLHKRQMKATCHLAGSCGGAKPASPAAGDF